MVNVNVEDEKRARTTLKESRYLSPPPASTFESISITAAEETDAEEVARVGVLLMWMLVTMSSRISGEGS